MPDRSRVMTQMKRGLGMRLPISPHKKIVTKHKKTKGGQGPPRAVELMIMIMIIIVIIHVLQLFFMFWYFILPITLKTVT
jgi:hypothetical protein